MKNSMEVPQKLKIELPYHPAVPLMDISIRKKKKKKTTNNSTNSKRYMYSNVYSSITYNSQDMKATHVSINR